MRAALRRAIPSMFHRRLLLLLVVMVCASGVLASQLFRLTVLEGESLRAEAERVLVSRKLIPTVRGTIYDRKGRVLAIDEPCYDIAIDYDVITGEWAYAAARNLAYHDNKSSWGEMSWEQREALIETYIPPFQAKLDALWDTMVSIGDIDAEELGRRRRTIVQRVQTIRSDVWERAAERRSQELGEPVELSRVAQPIAEERESHTILSAVPDRVAYAFRTLSSELPGVHVIQAKTRRYPVDDVTVTLDRSTLPSPIAVQSTQDVTVDRVCGHMLGSMREVWAEDVERRPFRHNGGVDLGGYLPGDHTGLAGIEQAEEDILRGTRGQQVTRRDTGDVQRVDAQRGHDVHLTIDVNLQARVRAIMDPDFGLMQVQGWHSNHRMAPGTPLYGAAVVMEVATGEIVAMVSTPMPPKREPGEPYPDLSTHPDKPLINRAISAVYPPGSTVKPIVYCIAAKTHAISINEQIDCRGHLLPNRDNLYRCWIYKSYGEVHGPLDPVGAIARSCNIYFFTCGKRIGAEALVANYRLWGLGDPPGLGLRGEVDGLLPSLTSPNPEGRGLTVPNSILMGIGQGPIAVSPLQVATAHVALARGGHFISPLLIRERAATQVQRDLGISRPVIDLALEGMRDVVEARYGSANHLTIGGQHEPILNTPDLILRAKTGTAQAPTQYEMVRDGHDNLVRTDHVLRDGDHSWFVCHVQRKGEESAAYVIVVVVEYGGSGGRVSGPVANQIIHALKAEGYL
ncbi:MAG: hypothetical protein GC159_04235 [Phycisphaera sp.]|nr:hypothetical protein [Phycisphaera sp.]